MTLTNEDLQAISSLIPPIHSRLDSIEHRLEKVESEVSALKVGQTELKKQSVACRMGSLYRRQKPTRKRTPECLSRIACYIFASANTILKTIFQKGEKHGQTKSYPDDGSL